MILLLVLLQRRSKLLRVVWSVSLVNHISHYILAVVTLLCGAHSLAYLRGREQSTLLTTVHLRSVRACIIYQVTDHRFLKISPGWVSLLRLCLNEVSSGFVVGNWDVLRLQVRVSSTLPYDFRCQFVAELSFQLWLGGVTPTMGKSVPLPRLGTWGSIC
jgi:hypothetical protein